MISQCNRPAASFCVQALQQVVFSIAKVGQKVAKSEPADVGGSGWGRECVPQRAVGTLARWSTIG